MRLLNWYKGDLGEETIENFVRYMFPNPKEPASETVRGAFKFADSAVAGIASRCPQVISAMLEMNNLFTILKQPDEISQQERSAKRG
jgi:hypothetical protein